MASKNRAEGGAKKGKGKGQAGTRILSVFPTDIARKDRVELTQLEFRPNGMAAEVISALKRHGVEAGESRKHVFEQVKSKFVKASDATVKTQVYRGIVYLR
jgi:hypothetical protein